MWSNIYNDNDPNFNGPRSSAAASIPLQLLPEFRELYRRIKPSGVTALMKLICKVVQANFCLSSTWLQFGRRTSKKSRKILHVNYPYFLQYVVSWIIRHPIIYIHACIFLFNFPICALQHKNSFPLLLNLSFLHRQAAATAPGSARHNPWPGAGECGWRQRRGEGQRGPGRGAELEAPGTPQWAGHRLPRLPKDIQVNTLTLPSLILQLYTDYWLR